ncbi:prepilin-type N-terminal cleavage/methylation domain-containing protein [candidate division TA06 bacterium]|nr:prepilin-type N-terminal cleavage/methylation domain-containing protein [candidate division TA06 bacterium]
MKNQKGFSLLEFLAAMVIVFALATIGYSQYVTSAENAKQAAIIANMYSIQLSAEDFSTQADGVYAGGINTEVAQVCPANPTNHNVMAGATKQPFPSEALISVDFVNPVDSTHDAIRNGLARKPFGCVYYLGLDAAGNPAGEGNYAVGYKITAMGPYRPLTIICSSGGKGASHEKK